MSSQHRLSRLTYLAMASLMPALAQDVYDCGNLNQRACGVLDFEYANMVAGDNRACEHGLKKVDGVCRDDNRNTYGVRNNFTWAGWALENQTSQLGKDLPINFVTWPTAHNAYSNTRQGFESFLYTNQVLSITDQLNAGARAIELDPKYYLMTGLPIGIPVSQLAVRLCHASSVALCALPGYANRLFGMALQEVATWLDANPGQVVYIKLDNKSLGGAMAQLELEVERYLGHRVFRDNFPNPSRWPTLQEIRNAKKSVIIVRHNSGDTPNGNWIFNGVGRFQKSNHPKNQDFERCIADDGRNQFDRGKNVPLTWWDSAEGRALTNFGDAFTGHFTESNVRQAAECGVSQIGLDFIHALNSTLNISPFFGPDRRFEAMIWSWEENDWGVAGPASMNARGRWSSLNPANALPVACARKREYGNTLQERDWRITAAEIPWNADLANARCQAEFGGEFEFASPRNGPQNKELRTLAAGRRVWLSHSNVRVPDLTFNTTSMNFRMNPGGNAPARQFVRIGAAPDTKLSARLSAALPVAFDLPANALLNGVYEMPVDITAPASNLASGVYNTNIVFSLNGVDQYTLPVSLVVRALPSISVTATPSTALRGSNVSVLVKLNEAMNPTGEFKLYRVADASGNPVPLETAAVGQIRSTSRDSGEGTVTVNNLPLGTHLYVAGYFGDQSNLGAETGRFPITITERIVPTPTSLSFRFTPGDTLTSQTVALSGLGSNPAATPACDWLKTDLSASNLRVVMADPIRNLAAGTYNCTVTVRDALTSQGFGQLEIPVQLAVLTTFNLQPVRPIELWGSTVASSGASITTANGSVVDFSATPLQPWLRVELIESNRTPGQIRIYADGNNLPVGTYRGAVRISSSLAADANFEVIFNRVNTSTITTLPAGRTVLVDGVSFRTPTNFVWQPNTQHTVSFPESIEDGVRYRGRNWSVNGAVTAGNTVTFTASRDGQALVANLDLDYRLTASVANNQGGAISLSPTSPDGFYPSGANVDVRALAIQGWLFDRWLGSATGTDPSTRVVMSEPRSVVASFRENRTVFVTFNSNVPGTAIVVDGAAVHNLPVVLSMTPGRAYTVTAREPLVSSLDTRWPFASWSNGGSQTQTIVAPESPTGFTAYFQTEFLIRLQASPANAGTVSGGGWRTAGSPVSIGASALPGFNFAGFTGDLVSPASSATFVVTGPRNIVANFTPAGLPQLTLAPGGARTDGVAADERIVPLTLTNKGLGLSTAARITGISGIRVSGGTGTVSVMTPMPVAFGDLAPGASATRNISFQWPASAQRVQFSVTYVDSSGLTGFMTLNLFR